MSGAVPLLTAHSDALDAVLDTHWWRGLSLRERAAFHATHVNQLNVAIASVQLAPARIAVHRPRGRGRAAPRCCTTSSPRTR